MISVGKLNGSRSMQTAKPTKDDPVVRHRKSMTPRDAVLIFVEVSETVNGENIHSQRMQQHPDVVTKMEGKYIFFADEAAIAKKMVSRGHSYVASVYFREP